MFDYDPTTMSPNPDGCEEELPFQEGDTIKVVNGLLCSVFCECLHSSHSHSALSDTLCLIFNIKCDHGFPNIPNVYLWLFSSISSPVMQTIQIVAPGFFYYLVSNTEFR